MNRKYTNLNDFQNCQIWKLKKNNNKQYKYVAHCYNSVIMKSLSWLMRSCFKAWIIDRHTTEEFYSERNCTDVLKFTVIFIFPYFLFLKPPQGGFVRNLRKMNDIVYQNRILFRRDAVLVSFDYSLLIC